MKKNQSGFGLIETLLIILILAVVSFGGYYVWHTQKNDKKSTSSQISQKTPTSTNQKSSNSSAQSYFSIPEWGVRAPFTASFTPEYSISTQGKSTWAYFSTKELNLSGSGCTTAGGSGGVINRLAAGQDLMSPMGTDTNETIEAAIASGDITHYSHVGSYYYFYEHPQAACGQSNYSQTIQQETETAITDLAKSLQAIPN